MGYTTLYEGSVSVTLALNEHEIAFLDRYPGGTSIDTPSGPYWFADQTAKDKAYHDGLPGRAIKVSGTPGHRCEWKPNREGTSLAWNGAGKFYHGEKWMQYLIAQFLGPGARLRDELAHPVHGRHYAAEFEHFTFDHVLEGTIEAYCADSGDRWRLVVRAGRVFVEREGKLVEVTNSLPVCSTMFGASLDGFILLGRMVGGPHDGEVWYVPRPMVADGLADVAGARYRSVRIEHMSGEAGRQGQGIYVWLYAPSPTDECDQVKDPPPVKFVPVRAEQPGVLPQPSNG